MPDLSINNLPASSGFESTSVIAASRSDSSEPTSKVTQAQIVTAVISGLNYTADSVLVTDGSGNITTDPNFTFSGAGVAPQLIFSTPDCTISGSNVATMFSSSNCSITGSGSSQISNSFICTIGSSTYSKVSSSNLCDILSGQSAEVSASYNSDSTSSPFSSITASIECKLISSPNSFVVAGSLSEINISNRSTIQSSDSSKIDQSDVSSILSSDSTVVTSSPYSIAACGATNSINDSPNSATIGPNLSMLSSANTQMIGKDFSVTNSANSIFLTGPSTVSGYTPSVNAVTDTFSVRNFGSSEVRGSQVLLGSNDNTGFIARLDSTGFLLAEGARYKKILAQLPAMLFTNGGETVAYPTAVDTSSISRLTLPHDFDTSATDLNLSMLSFGDSSAGAGATDASFIIRLRFYKAGSDYLTPVTGPTSFSTLASITQSYTTLYEVTRTDFTININTTPAFVKEPGDLINVEIVRIGTSPSDTYAGNVQFLSLDIIGPSNRFGTSI
jgi:hypothetical protein